MRLATQRHSIPEAQCEDRTNGSAGPHPARTDDDPLPVERRPGVDLVLLNVVVAEEAAVAGELVGGEGVGDGGV